MCLIQWVLMPWVATQGRCRPISARRYDYLWERLGEHLPWVKTQQVSMHWIRHILSA